MPLLKDKVCVRRYEVENHYDEDEAPILRRVYYCIFEDGTSMEWKDDDDIYNHGVTRTREIEEEMKQRGIVASIPDEWQFQMDDATAAPDIVTTSQVEKEQKYQEHKKQMLKGWAKRRANGYVKPPRRGRPYAVFLHDMRFAKNPNVERDAALVKRAAAGETISALSREFKLSRKRISVIIENQRKWSQK